MPLAIAVVGALLAGGVAIAAPASAAPSALLSVDKRVNGVDAVTVAPDEEFTYTVGVGCSDSGCVDATLVDQLPAEFAGFAILASSVGPASLPSSSSFAGCTTVVTSSCVFTAVFEQSLTGGEVGIQAGATYTASITLKAPANLTPSWASNGVAVANTATATATTADTQSDAANVTVAIPTTVNTAVTKSWTPATQQYAPGVESTVALTTRNTSNMPASSLVLQDPNDAADGATQLAASNPFALTDFTGFGTVTLPDGANRVRVDAYVFSGGVWTWQTGTPSLVADIALPGVADSAVGGLRFTFSDAASGATIDAGGTAGAVAFTVAQRSTNRNTGDSLVLGASVTNQVAGTVTVPGNPPVSKTATAPYAIGGLTVAVQAGKTITPARIPAGTSASASITGKNNSNGPLSSLTLGDTDYFTQDLQFGGFLSPVAYPAGATAASVTWHFSGPSTSSAPVTNGSTPVAPSAPPGEHLTGFEVTYTGAVAAGVTATLNFSISPTADIADAATQSVPNTVNVTGVNPAGTATASKGAPLSIFKPEIRLHLTKSISPVGAVTPGGTVLAKLATTTDTDSAYVNPTTIVVQDDYRNGTAGDFWDGFNPLSIAPTQVPTGASLLVEYNVGGVWTALPNDSGSAQLYQANLPGDVSTIIGVRFTFTNAAGFAQGVAVQPNVVFQARAKLRSDSATSTSVANGPASDYENEGVASGSGEVAGGVSVTSPDVVATADASIISFSGGDGGIVAGKRWQQPGFTGDLTTVNSQSGEQAASRLTWGVLSTGYDSVTVADPATNEANPVDTSFQAFDLKSVAPISFGQDPQLRYDTVDSVELYYAGAWHPVAKPAGSWMNGTGFKGYVLTAPESAATTGVRLVIKPNDTARTGSTDPLTPPVGSGVGSSSSAASRPLGLTWQLRNTVRSVVAPANKWATAVHGYNDADPATVANTVGVSGVLGGTPVTAVTATDKLTLLDQPPGVDVSKTRSVSTVVIPNSGDVAAGIYPAITYTITAKNTSSARASYLRVTDPMPCSSSALTDCRTLPTDWASAPFTAPYSTSNPFERENLTKIAFAVNAQQIDAAASTVTLWKRDAAGVMTTQDLSMTAATALTAAQLEDVVGVSVLYQGTDPLSDGGMITTGSNPVMTLSTQLRVHERSAPTVLVAPVTISNDVFAQSYDPVVTPSGASSTPVDSANADVALVDGVLDVTATKTLAPGTMLEKNRTDPVTVTLKANQGNSTVATNEVVMEDSDQAFWSRFRLTALGTVTAPAGSNQVRVDVQTNGTATWIQGVAGPTAVLPAVDLADVSGIRFTFNNDDADVFSHSSPPANWAAQALLTVQLLDTKRGTSTAIPFPSTVTNVLSTSSERFEDPAIYVGASAQSSDSLALDPGTFQLDVAKSPLGNVHTVSPGASVPWTLKFANTGSGYLTIADLVDQLPTYLSFDGEEPSYTGSAGGTLSTAPTYSYDGAAKTLTFSWPTGGKRMSPGETFTVTLGLILEPGLTSGDRATNEMTVTTAETLTACTNTSGNVQGVLTGLGATECGTSNYVQPIAGPSIVTRKGVKGDIAGSLVSGAVNVNNPAVACIPDDEGYFRTPCAANTVIGGTDEWKLQAVNSGTVDYTGLTFVDPLPLAGDRMLATGSARGSTYRPVFDGANGLQVTGAPGDATMVWEVTTTANACLSAGATSWPSDPTCSTHPSAAGWTSGASFAGDWADVTALRVTFGFPTPLPAGGTVTVKYHTVNTVASAALPQGAPTTVSASPAYAWNQFGANATLVAGQPIKGAPVKAGVTIVTGPLQLSKAVAGAGSAFAPGDFVVDIACSIDGEALDLGTSSSLHLTTAGSFTARVDGIPLGSSCVATEHGSLGTYGESSRTNSPVTLAIDGAAASADPVPLSQQATITNTYTFGGLSVTKHVDTEATVGTFGPFDFTLSCVSGTGDPISLPAADRSFSLAAEATHTVAANTLPVNAVCTLTETDAAGANATALSGTGVTDLGGGVGTVVVGAASSVTVTNTFLAGTLSVLKTVDGAGAAGYGTGPFTASVRCVYGTPEQVVYSNAALAIVPAVPSLVPEVFPVGTTCSVNEATTGGANSHDDPASVTIPAPTGGAAVGAITADVTNHFLVGDLVIDKVRLGAGVAAFGDGPFKAQVECTWVKDGATLAIPLPDSGEVTLSSGNGYTATLSGIIVGASCAVTETDAGLASASSLSPASGIVTILDPVVHPTPATVTITNQFDVGQLKLRKSAGLFALKDSAVHYTITVSNIGHVEAQNVVVTDLIPAGARVVSADSGGAIQPGKVVWTVPSIAVGDTTDLGVVLKYDAAGEYINHASVQLPTGAWDPTEVDDECVDMTGASCATVFIATLAFTGASPMSTILTGFLALALGAALLFYARIRRRRVRRS
ncbi:DUF5979 domain-containing protein [Parafrigoribacterium soli]|uniref:DUF5979 domain-containing protein n=1 Tax=Parafrigoribacterium soli TaxID=3144663 RepID=UPI0032EC6BEE